MVIFNIAVQVYLQEYTKRNSFWQLSRISHTHTKYCDGFPLKITYPVQIKVTQLLQQHGLEEANSGPTSSARH